MPIEEPKITDWLALVVGVIALAQPWGMAAWLRFVAKPKVRIYPHRFVEIGFSNFGPTLGLRGAIRSENRDAFVYSIKVDVIRKKDEARIKFDWFAKKEERTLLSISVPGKFQEEASVTVPTGFLIGPSLATGLNYFFCNASLQPIQASIVRKMTTEWNSWLLKNSPTEPISTIGEFTKTSEAFLDLQKFFDREFFWWPGEYQVSVVPELDGHNCNATRFSFHLDDADSEKLKANFSAVIFEVCAGRAIYHFSYPTIKKQT